MKNIEKPDVINKIQILKNQIKEEYFADKDGIINSIANQQIRMKAGSNNPLEIILSL